MLSWCLSCELVGVYILHLLRTIMRKENVGLHRDDGVGILRNSSGPEIERKRKQIIQIFKSCGLNITVKTSLKTVDFLDVRLDLINNTYQPYRKPNSETVYINKDSNHPPNVLKELPKAINKRITDILCNQDIFNAANLLLFVLNALGDDKCLNKKQNSLTNAAIRINYC